MKSESIKVGIVGSGFAARFHMEALKRVFSAIIKVKGAYSKNSDNLKIFTDKYQIIPFKNLDDLIDNCDVIHVCTPPVTHEAIVIEALKKDKYVIVEKPFTGYFGDGSKDFSGDNFSREIGLEKTLESIKRMLDAEKKKPRKNHVC